MKKDNLLFPIFYLDSSVINNVDAALLERLKKNAAVNGVSPEEEVKNILEKELTSDRAAIKKQALTRLTEIRKKYTHLQKTRES